MPVELDGDDERVLRVIAQLEQQSSGGPRVTVDTSDCCAVLNVLTGFSKPPETTKDAQQ